MNNSIGVKLDQAGAVWFNELKIRASLYIAGIKQPSDIQSKAIDGTKLILDKAPDDLNQQDVFDLENWLLDLMSQLDLKQWVLSVRDDYRDVFGAQAFQQIAPNLLPKVETATLEELKAEATRLQKELHWQAAIQPWAQGKRRNLMKSLLIMLVCLVVFAVIFCSVSNHAKQEIDFAAVICIFGAFGAFISCIQRVQSANIATSQALSMSRYNDYEIGVFISPLLGTVFALILTLLLLAKLTPTGFVIPDMSLENIDGRTPNTQSNETASLHGNIQSNTNPITSSTILPTVNATSNAVTSTTDKQAPASGVSPQKSDQLQKDRLYCVPFFNMWIHFKDGKEIAILLVWAFLAGFSERLVPDMLTRLEDKAKT